MTEADKKKEEAKKETILRSAIASATAEVIFPKDKTYIGGYNEYAELLEDKEEVDPSIKDDAQFIVDRRGNQLWIALKIKPTKTHGDVKFTLRIIFELRKTEGIETTTFVIHFNLGKVQRF